MKHHLSADELGRELRSGSSRFLKRRRSIIGLTFLSCSVLGAIALYQMGLIKTLPGHLMDSENLALSLCGLFWRRRLPGRLSLAQCLKRTRLSIT